MAKRISSNGKELEKLVSRIYKLLKENPIVRVIHDVKLSNIIKRKSQFDVIIKTTGSNKLTAIECKDYKGRIGISHLHDFQGRCGLVKEVDRKIFVTINGYQAGAKEVAELYQIELYRLSEVTPELIRRWIKIEKSYATYPDIKRLGDFHFYLSTGEILTYKVGNLDLQMPLVELDDELMTLNDIIKRISASPVLDKFAHEDFQKTKINGDEKSVIVPIPIQAMPVTGLFYAILSGRPVYIKKIEIVFEYVYIVTKLKNPVAKSYQLYKSEGIAEVVTAQIGDMKLEIIRDSSNGQEKYFVTDLNKQVSEIPKEHIINFLL